MTALCLERPRPVAVHSPEGRTSSTVPIERRQGGRSFASLDWVAEEVPISLEYNGLAHAVMLASPQDLEDFALGFSLSEGIIASTSEIGALDIAATENGIRVAMTITGRRFHALKHRRRSLAGTTGCGLCGIESLEQAVRPLSPVEAGRCLSASALAEGLGTLAQGQPLMTLTGATHAAGWLRADGVLSHVREDVGRHNALDKLIGAMAMEREDISAGCLLVTSRASFEMVQKAVSVGIGMLAAISAPTHMAIQTAERSGLTLIGFARGENCVVYTHGHRLTGHEGDRS